VFTSPQPCLYRKEVVVDVGDIRNPRLHHYLKGKDEKKGLTNFLVDDSQDLASLIQTSKESEHLKVLFSGPIPPNPAELWMSKRTNLLFDILKLEYDNLIVDTAPCLLVTDTFLINNFAVSTLYVVLADYTERKLLDFPKENVALGKLKNTAFYSTMLSWPILATGINTVTLTELKNERYFKS